MTNLPEDEAAFEALFERAATIAETALEGALTQAGDAAEMVPIAMLEVAVNRALDFAEPGDVIEILQDLMLQVQADLAANEQ